MLASSSAPSTLGYNSSPQAGLPSGPRIGLPSGPRDTSTAPSRSRNLRPNMHFEGQGHEQPDDSSATPQEALEELVSEFHSLTSSLPRENRDLLMTITELLQKAAGQSRTTKMPLSNLLLVLCPSMNMNPGVLKIFVEHHQAIFAEPTRAPNQQTMRTPVEPNRSVEPASPDDKNPLEFTPPEYAPENSNLTDCNPSEAVSSDNPRHASDTVIPNNVLPVRRQSLRRSAQASPGVRTTPTSSPSAYRETFVTDSVPNYSDLSGRIEPVHTVVHESSITGSPKSTSTPASPLHQSFSALDLSRPAQPTGPRGPRTIPAPLALQKDRPNTPERSQTLTRTRHLRSASSSSTVGRDMQWNPSVPVPIKVEKPTDIPASPDIPIEPRSILTPQSRDSPSPSSQGDTTRIPSLPEVRLQSPISSSFVDRRSVMPIAKVDQLHPAPALSDAPPSAWTPKTADSSTSSQGEALTFPLLPEVYPLPPMTSSFADRRSAVPIQPQLSPASLGVPSPDSAQSVVQPLTPLLAAMEKENAPSPSSLLTSPDPGTGELNNTHPTVEPLTLVKKNTSNGTSQVDGHAGFDSDSAPYSASSTTTDMSDNTNIFDRQLSWPEVPKTIPVVKPSQNGLLNQQLSSTTTDRLPSLEPLIQASGQHSTAQYVMVDDRDDSDLSATTIQSKFLAETNDDGPPVSPVVANGQYPPVPYPPVPFTPQNSEKSQPEKSGPTSDVDVLEGTVVTLPRPHAKQSSSGDLRNEFPTMDTATLSMHAHAPRLTINSKDMLAGNSFWANELQRALRSSSPTSAEARHSAELSSMLEAAGT
jgi:RhoGAP domain